jgi:hypothetical protein
MWSCSLPLCDHDSKVLAGVIAINQLAPFGLFGARGQFCFEFAMSRIVLLIVPRFHAFLYKGI